MFKTKGFMEGFFVVFFFFAESVLCRTLASSRHFSPSARLDIIRNKFGEIKAGETLSEEEYTDRIGTHAENFRTTSTESTDCFEENHGDNMYLEIYSINESELQATSGKTQFHVNF